MQSSLSPPPRAWRQGAHAECVILIYQRATWTSSLAAHRGRCASRPPSPPFHPSPLSNLLDRLVDVSSWNPKWTLTCMFMLVCNHGVHTAMQMNLHMQQPKAMADVHPLDDSYDFSRALT